MDYRLKFRFQGLLTACGLRRLKGSAVAEGVEFAGSP